MRAGAMIDPRRGQNHRQAIADPTSSSGEPYPKSALQPSSVPWGLPTAFAVLVVAFVGANILALLAAALLTAGLGSAFDQRYPLSWTMVALQMQAIAVGLAIGWLVLHRFHVDLGRLGVRLPTWRGLLIGIGGALGVVVANALITLPFEALAPGYLRGNAEETFGGALHLGTREAILLFLVVTVQVPLVEEILFRGVLHQAVRRFFAGLLPTGVVVPAAVLMSGAIFGLAHAQPQTLPYLIVAGVVYASVFERTGSIFASAVAHGSGNALAFTAWILTL